MLKYTAIGLMSGTSLDGIDVTCCNYFKNGEKWEFEFLKGQTIPYSKEWKQKLSEVENKSALEFSVINSEYGHLLGKHAAEFIKVNRLKVDFVSSHGHTIFHQPDKKLTVQIGSGSSIAAECLLPVVCDFRTLDVALNGQGAPLVPAGEIHLFNEYPMCLNIGGFANITLNSTGKRSAFDICPANIVLNYLVNILDPSLEYDPLGINSSNGKIDYKLLNSLNEIEFYKSSSHKSLGKEWVLKNIYPLLLSSNNTYIDLLRTFTEHISIQISKIINEQNPGKVLITGGGAFNSFLIERIKALSKHELVIPSEEIILFKEAIIFGFLGVLRMEKKPNCLKSVTGADFDNVGGAVYWPKS
ncbi:MAG: anhydro-N-acetylmuramic acid kinase [Bacteroidota bacterium]|nr:anhydro-N-acetylmuramic acid kinase [Bacteroidota bacterium]